MVYLRLKTYGFLRCLYVFYSILVSSLSVPLYASRSSAKDFCTKSVCPGLSYLGITENKKFERYFISASLFINSYIRCLRLKTCGFLHLIVFCFLLSFPHSPYPCTAIARQPTISAPNPFARGCLGHNRIKNCRGIVEIQYLCFYFLQILII